MNKPECLQTMPFPAYNSAPGMRASLLKQLRKSPRHYRWFRDNDRPDTAALMLGRIVHTIVLEGEDALQADYVTDLRDAPRNPKTGELYGLETKTFQKWIDEHHPGKQIAPPGEVAFARSLRESIWAHPHNPLAAGGWAEQVIEFEYEGHQCKARLDFVTVNGVIVDLKTCGDLDWFEHDARKYEYLHALAFYREAMMRRTGIVMPCYLLAVEKSAPHATGVWEIAGERLDECAAENAAALRRLTQLEYGDEWPTGYEEVRMIG